MDEGMGAEANTTRIGALAGAAIDGTAFSKENTLVRGET